ncbi:MAG: type III-A CRISPR-associated RAMP protein Csm3 [Myxococcales bacterium]|nr:type III-A CRISPR-associated RAMP protein Csm3 [Myxococcota bacterium]MDW8284389.1 type III-A CRISPR-associated RAMP protein Csm3 [Myxococcales bacterium]
MQLTKIAQLTGRIRLETGLHIGAGDAEMHIGGTDNPIVRHPVTRRPYIPGSSLKGKMRSLLEWKSGAVQPEPLGYKDLKNYAQGSAEIRSQIEAILKLFGLSGGEKEVTDAIAREIGPTRLAFWDCPMCDDWAKPLEAMNQPLSEVKSENRIDRIRGVAEHPRNTERVPAGAEFEFRLSIRVLDGEDLLDTVKTGLRLIELDGLGGSCSRGYGKVKFIDLELDGVAFELPADPFTSPIAPTTT